MATQTGKNIMMIDDNQIDQMLHRRIVERSGLVEHIQCHLYADEALAYLQSDQLPKPDIILLDINMPRMDGFEFLEAFSALTGQKVESMVIVMLTTSLDTNDEKRASGFDAVKGFLKKPLSQESLETILQL